jgi:hypothetical protein
VSGLYYAMFHVVCAHLSFDPHREHRHRQLLEDLKRSRDAARVKAAGRLESLYEGRLKADYRPTQPILPHELATAVNHGRAVQKLLGIELVPTPNAAPPPAAGAEAVPLRGRRSDGEA